MITDKTLDETLVELLRCKKALEALRAERKSQESYCPRLACTEYGKKAIWCFDECGACGTDLAKCAPYPGKHAAAKRASMDLTRKLAALRAGR